MLILFGTRRTEKQLTAGNEYRCPRCGNVRHWPVVQYTSWFSLFFVPLIPYRKKYYEMCPICRAGREVSAGQAQRLEKK
ncbi:MAG: zinc-ribbon domain-containing protein [Lachnospiraceae bacterium]|nr:zinc-ribbon domain-containing protein [Lachnospiraceae bacterium]